MIIFVSLILMLFLMLFLIASIVSYCKTRNEFKLLENNKNSLRTQLDSLNSEYITLNDKFYKTLHHYDKIKKIFNDLSELNSQTLESSKDRLTKLYQIKTENYSNKDNVKKELEYYIDALNKELIK